MATPSYNLWYPQSSEHASASPVGWDTAPMLVTTITGLVVVQDVWKNIWPPPQRLVCLPYRHGAWKIWSHYFSSVNAAWGPAIGTFQVVRGLAVESLLPRYVNTRLVEPFPKALERCRHHQYFVYTQLRTQMHARRE